MKGVLRQIWRVWVAIFVAYALLVNAVLPGYAMARMADFPPGVLCLPSLADDSSDPGGTPGHEADCCILCAAAASPALAPPVLDVAPLHLGFVETILLPPTAEPLRGPSSVWPQSPRAPPIKV